MNITPGSWPILLGALVALVAGAELLVRGATGLAERLRISPLVVGLTVVAFGTSSPEVVVSLSAVFGGQPGIAAGNAVGSNIFNVLFILGISAIIRPLVVAEKLIRIDVPIMIGVSALFWALSLDGLVGRIDGLVLFAGLVAFTFGSIVASRREQPSSTETNGPASDLLQRPAILKSTTLIVGGLGLAILGGRWFVNGAVAIATTMGLSEEIVGLTIVAAGTSLPEVATSLVAVIRGQRDIAVGNVVGSNIFNLLGILGLAGLVAPNGLEIPSGLLAFDAPVLVAAAIACLPIVFTGNAISRWEGGLLLGAYVAYVTYLVLAPGDHDALSGFSTVMVWFALPVATLGILSSVIASSRRGRDEPPHRGDLPLTRREE